MDGGESFGCFDAQATSSDSQQWQWPVHALEHPGFAQWTRRFWPQIRADASALRQDVRQALLATPTYPGTFRGRGIVMAVRQHSAEAALATLKLVRVYGCELAVEVWYLRGELREDVLRQYQVLGATVHMFENHFDAADLQHVCWNAHARLMQLLPLAVIHSQFEEVLFLDANTAPLRNMGELFDDVQYRTAGAMFWPDYFKLSVSNPVWDALDLSAADAWSVDAGAVLFNKRKCWIALHYAVHLHTEPVMKVVLEPDALQLAFRASKTDFYLAPHRATPVGMMDELSGRICGLAALQRDARGSDVFLRLHAHVSHQQRQQLDLTHAMEIKDNSERVRVVPAELPVLQEGGELYPCVTVEDFVKHKSEQASSFRIVERDMGAFVREFHKASQQVHRFVMALPPLGLDPGDTGR